MGLLDAGRCWREALRSPLPKTPSHNPRDQVKARRAIESLAENLGKSLWPAPP